MSLPKIFGGRLRRVNPTPGRKFDKMCCVFSLIYCIIAGMIDKDLSVGRLWSLRRGALLDDTSAVVLLGGCPPRSAELLGYIRRSAFVAAADSGASAALAAGRRPDLLVGDFDSLDAAALAECRRAQVEICSLPVHKDQTDGEYLLGRLAGLGYSRLLIMGGLGGRLDHTLANIFTVLPLAAAGCQVCFCGDDMLACVLAADDVPRELCLEGFAGLTLSLQSLSAECRRVELSGFEYPLGGRLAQTSSLGISNVIRDAAVRVRLVGGSLLVCLNLQPLSDSAANDASKSD